MEKKPKVSAELQQTVIAHPNIDTVHFDAKGGHHFNVHDEVIPDKVDAKNKVKTWKKTGRTVAGGGVVVMGSMTREEVLNAEIETDQEQAAPVVEIKGKGKSK